MEHNQNQELQQQATLHLIDDEANLQNGIENFLKVNGMMNQNKKYNIISIIGSQSSGKSTLLNNLFSTKFQVLDSKGGRTQTTKGIWVSKDHEQPLLVLDVEGSDSKSRGDNRQFYEQSTALFALAISQVLIINIWTYDIGRFTGQQIGIIKVIMEMNIKLFKQDQTKDIVFVLRDFTQIDENFSYIENEILKDVEQCWQEISKPPQFANLSHKQLFKIHVFPLVPLKYMKEQFEMDVKSFRNWFVNPNDNHYLFREFNYNQNLPIDGLKTFIQTIWQAIKSNKDLNLPNQKIMASTIRCEDIKQESLQLIQKQLEELGKAGSKSLLPNFGQSGKIILNSAISYYQEHAHDYVQDIFMQKYNELQQKLVQEIYKIFEKQLTLHKKDIQEQIRKIFDKMTIRKDQLEEFSKNVMNLQQQYKQSNTQFIMQTTIAENFWDVNSILQELNEIIQQQVLNYLQIKLNDYLKQIENSMRNKINEMVYSQYEQFKPSFWNDLSAEFQQFLKEVNKEIIVVLQKCFLLNQDQIAVKLQQNEDYCLDQLTQIVKKTARSINEFMIKKFKNQFLRDDKTNKQRNWQLLQENEIEKLFLQYRNDILNDLKVFKNFELQVEKSNQEQQLSSHCEIMIEQKDYQKIIVQFQEESENEYQSALNKKKGLDLKSVPRWFWFILVFFAYDNVIAWFNTPMISYPLIFLGIIFGLLYAAGYGNYVTGFISMLKTFFTLAKRSLVNKQA